ncbi:MAG: hypothetical protein ACREJO_18930, partial [Phycisphaerales bacterium]
MGFYRTKAQAKADWRRLSLGMKTLLLGGVLFMFAPIGLFMMLVARPVPMVPFALISGLVAGLIATGWTWSFTSRKFWALPIVIAFQIFAPGPLFSWLSTLEFTKIPAEGVGEQGRAGVIAIVCVLCIIAAFTMMFSYARLQESRSARARAELDLAGRIHATIVPDLSH